jgi:hypothetical protein
VRFLQQVLSGALRPKGPSILPGIPMQGLIEIFDVACSWRIPTCKKRNESTGHDCDNDVSLVQNNWLG